MNKNDLAIISFLSNMKKLSVSSIASESGVSKGTVRNRINFMSKNGILIGYKARLRYNLIGMSEAIVGLEIAPEGYIQAVEALKSNNNIKELYTTSGDHSAIAIIVSPREKISGEIQALTGITGVMKVYPAIVTDIVK